MKHVGWITFLVLWLTCQPQAAEAMRTVLIGEKDALIGVDQIAVTKLFHAWEPAGTELLLACSGVFTFTLIFGRAMLGIPFLKSVYEDLTDGGPSEEDERDHEPDDPDS